MKCAYLIQILQLSLAVTTIYKTNYTIILGWYPFIYTELLILHIYQ